MQNLVQISETVQFLPIVAVQVLSLAAVQVLSLAAAEVLLVTAVHLSVAAVLVPRRHSMTSEATLKATGKTFSDAVPVLH